MKAADTVIGDIVVEQFFSEEADRLTFEKYPHLPHLHHLMSLAGQDERKCLLRPQK